MSNPRIEIAVTDESEPARSGTSADTDLLDRWKRLTDAMAKATDDVSARAARRGASPSAGGAASGTALGTALGTAADRVAERAEQRSVDAAEWQADRARRAADREAKRRQHQEKLAGERREKEDKKATEKAEEEAKKERLTQHNRSATGAIGGGTIGRYAGAALGAAVGGPAGAAIGGALGGVVGNYAGGKAFGKRDEKADEADMKAQREAGRLVPVHPVVQAGIDAAEKGARFVGRAFQEAGEMAAKVAGNDGFGALRQGVDLAAEGLEGIPVVGKAAGEGLRMLGRAVGAAEQAMSAFAARGKELAQYSGTLSAAAARQDVTRMLGDIREARRLEKEYAAMIQVQTEMSETIRAGLEPLKRMAMTWLPEILGKMLDVLIASLECLDQLTPGPTVWGEMAAEMRKTREEIQRGAGEDPDIDKWLIPVPMPRFDPAGPLADPRGLVIPLIPGS